MIEVCYLHCSTLMLVLLLNIALWGTSQRSLTEPVVRHEVLLFIHWPSESDRIVLSALLTLNGRGIISRFLISIYSAFIDRTDSDRHVRFLYTHLPSDSDRNLVCAFLISNGDGNFNRLLTSKYSTFIDQAPSNSGVTL